MALDAERIDPPAEDAISNYKWVLLAIVTFGVLAWAATNHLSDRAAAGRAL